MPADNFKIRVKPARVAAKLRGGPRASISDEIIAGQDRLLRGAITEALSEHRFFTLGELGELRADFVDRLMLQLASGVRTDAQSHAPLKDNLADLRRKYICEARGLGANWVEIAKPLGVSRVAVRLFFTRVKKPPAQQRPFLQMLREDYQYLPDGSLVRLGRFRGGVLRTNNGRGLTGHVGGGRKLVHRLVWMYHYGDIPEGFSIDHINRDPFDNRIENLRLARHNQNLRNTSLRSSNTSGFKGVHRSRSRWAATITVDGVSRRIGTFDTAEAAARGYDEAALRLHGEFACTNAMLGLLPSSPDATVSDFRARANAHIHALKAAKAA